MFKKWILFLIYLKICLCSLQSYVNFDISRENNIQRFPWMVIISGDDKKNMFAYGTLIHKRAVLTLSIMEPNELYYFNFRVFAECYFTEHTLNYHCPEVRGVNEYNIIKEFENDSDGNLAILILSEPFTLSKTINVVHFARHDTDFHHTACVIIALKNLVSSHGLQLKARMMTPSKVKIVLNSNNYLEYNLWLNNSNLIIYDDEGRPEEFKNETAKYLIDYSGGPVICKSTHIKDHWLQVGVINFAIIIRYDKLEYTYSGEVTRVDINDIHEILNEIIKKSHLSGKFNHESWINVK